MIDKRSIARTRRSLPAPVREAERGRVVELTGRGEPVAVLVGRKHHGRLVSTRRGFVEAYREFTRAVDLSELALDPDEAFARTREKTPGREVRSRPTRCLLGPEVISEPLRSEPAPGVMRRLRGHEGEIAVPALGTFRTGARAACRDRNPRTDESVFVSASNGADLKGVPTMNEVAGYRVGPMADPPHPGELIRESMDDAGWNVTETEMRLGCERGTLSRLLNGRAGVSASMALALEGIGWGTAEHWMRMQASHELARARRNRTSGT